MPSCSVHRGTIHGCAMYSRARSRLIEYPHRRAQSTEGFNMIARVWTAEARGNGDAYARFFRGFVRQMQELKGFEGAQLLRRRVAAKSQIKVVSFWKSMRSI